MSAFSVSRMALPLSQVSATARSSRFSIIRSAIWFRIRARCAGEVLPQAGAAWWAASRASSMSSSVPLAASVNCLPVIGETFSKYLPLVGGTHFPPIQFS
jgi:hypothetical protein